MQSPSICLSIVFLAVAMATAQTVVPFNFDNAPLYSPLPVAVTAGGVTAQLSATGQGYSIQSTSTAPVVPVGFSGRFIYPSSVFPADLIISFSQTITAFSILYSPQELGCDDSARMKVTAYLNGTSVGFATMIAPNPGTWPTATLACSFVQGFNSVVVHYDAPPPTCTDWGPIFLADDMSITVPPVASIASVGSGCGAAGSPVLTCTTPRIGQNVTLSLSQATPNAAGFVYYSPVPGAPLPIGACYVVELDLAHAAELVPLTTNAVGTWTLTMPMPPAPSLVGVHAAMQAAVFPTAGPFGFDLTNGLIATIGY